MRVAASQGFAPGSVPAIGLLLVGFAGCGAAGGGGPGDGDAATRDAAAAGDGGDAACGGGLDVVELPTRVHLLDSAYDALRATVTEETFAPFVARANELLAQACLRVVVESTVRDALSADQEALYADALANGTDDPLRTMGQLMPAGQLLTPGWDVMVFKTFRPIAPASGVYVRQLGAVLFAEDGPPGEPNVAAVLAHEFGHSLGLTHYTGADADRNLMVAEIFQLQATATSLTEAQIAQARAQAVTGEPLGP